MKRPLFSVLILYLVGTLSVGFVYFAQTSYNTSGKDNPTAFVEAAQVGLSWPWLVVQAVADRPS
jgi:hypothetical protein